MRPMRILVNNYCKNQHERNSKMSIVLVIAFNLQFNLSKNNICYLVAVASRRDGHATKHQRSMEINVEKLRSETKDVV